MGRALELTGLSVGRLTVRECVGVDKWGTRLWVSDCICGGTSVSEGSKLTREKNPVSSCGCLRVEGVKKANTTHGLCTTQPRLRNIHYLMLQRCNNPNTNRYKYYGGKGVTVCQEWQDPVAFVEWALVNGYEEDLSIDRLDSDKGYYPGNCEWVTLRENSLRMTKSRKWRNLSR